MESGFPGAGGPAFLRTQSGSGQDLVFPVGEKGEAIPKVPGDLFLDVPFFQGFVGPSREP